MTRRVRLVAAAGGSIGRGHVGRILALGAALADRGAQAEIELLAGELTEGERMRARAHGLGLADGPPAEVADVVVVDVPEPWPVPRHLADSRLVVFDDRNRFRGRAAIVVQPSRSTWDGGGEAQVVLAGYGFVPIDPAYRRGRAAATAPGARRVAGRSVIVCFGGSDPHDVTHRIAPALAGVASSVTVVLGASYRGSGPGAGVAVLHDPADLVDRLAAADIAVVGAGTMKFEVACLGRPAVLLAVADDQLAVGPPFAATGAAAWLGDGRTVDPQSVADEVGRLLDDAARLAAMGRTAADLVDGLGADRIAEAILALDGQVR